MHVYELIGAEEPMLDRFGSAERGTGTPLVRERIGNSLIYLGKCSGGSSYSRRWILALDLRWSIEYGVTTVDPEIGGDSGARMSFFYVS